MMMMMVTLFWRSDKDDRSKGKDFEDQIELRVRKIDVTVSSEVV